MSVRLVGAVMLLICKDIGRLIKNFSILYFVYRCTSSCQEKKLSEIAQKAGEAVAHILFVTVLTGDGIRVEINLLD